MLYGGRTSSLCYVFSSPLVGRGWKNRQERLTQSSHPHECIHTSVGLIKKCAYQWWRRVWWHGENFTTPGVHTTHVILTSLRFKFRFIKKSFSSTYFSGRVYQTFNFRIMNPPAFRTNCLLIYRQMRRRRMRSSTSSQDTPASGEGALERNKYLSLEEARVRRHRPPTVRAETLHLGGSNSIIRDTTRQKYSWIAITFMYTGGHGIYLFLNQCTTTLPWNLNWDNYN